MSPEDRARVVAFATAMFSVKHAAELDCPVTLDADQAKALIWGINLVRERRER